VTQEHHTNVENTALPPVEAALLATAFEAHPYRNPTNGWPGDAANLGMADAQAFFAKYYVPENIVIAMVGDVYPAGAALLVDKYFGRIPARPAPLRLHTAEPPQLGMKTAALGADVQPLIAIGYKRPDEYSRDDAALDLIQILLSGRTGILQGELVEKGIAQTAVARATFPAGREPNLFLFLMSPAPGHTLDDLQKGLDEVLAQLQNRLVTQQALGRVKAQFLAAARRRLANNADLAGLLPAYYAAYGDWRRLFQSLEATNKVTPEAMQQAAIRCFTLANRTIVYAAAGMRNEALPARSEVPQ
jgi:predicted Zn-dependent peptidase